jgi:hypothetical protein
MMRQGIEERHYASEVKQWSQLAAAVAKSEEEAEQNAINYVLASHSGKASSVKQEPAPLKKDEHLRTVEQLIKTIRKAFGYLYAALPADLRPLVAEVPQGYAYGIWSFLEEKFRNTEQDSILSLWTQFNNMKQEEDESFDVYKARVDSVKELLIHAKQPIPGGLYAAILLHRLQPKYTPALLALKTSDREKDPEKYDWVELRRYIAEYERSRIGLGESDTFTDRALAARGGDSQQGNVTRGQVKGKRKQESNRTHLAQVECYNCGKLGHYAVNCKAPKRNKTSSSAEKQGGKGGQRKASARQPKASRSPDDEGTDDESNHQANVVRKKVDSDDNVTDDDCGERTYSARAQAGAASQALLSEQKKSNHRS